MQMPGHFLCRPLRGLDTLAIQLTSQAFDLLRNKLPNALLTISKSLPEPDLETVVIVSRREVTVRALFVLRDK